MAELTGYDLSREWFNYCFENPEKINTNQTALYFFIIEHCNRLGWKNKFGLPTTMAMEALGIKSYNTYKATLNALIVNGFVVMVEVSKNQYSANIIALSKNIKALDKALDKALIKHGTKQSESTVQSNDSIDKQLTINNKQITSDDILLWTDCLKYFFNDFRWKEKFCRDKNLRMPVMEQKMREFTNDLELKEDFKDLKELKRHFTNWFNKNKDLSPGQSASNGTGRKLQEDRARAILNGGQSSATGD